MFLTGLAVRSELLCKRKHDTHVLLDHKQTTNKNRASNHCESCVTLASIATLPRV